MITRFFLFFMSLLAGLSLLGQADFRELYEAEDPIPGNSDLPFEERLRIHREYGMTAVSSENFLQQILGELYVFQDYLNYDDFSSADEHLLRAETLAEASGNIGWQGGVAYRRGSLFIRLREMDKAISAYKDAVEKCKAAGDSLCVAEGLGQIGTSYYLKRDYPPAQRYFDLYLPMLERHGGREQLAKSYSNYAGFLNQQKRHHEALPYIRQAVALYAEIGNYRLSAKAKNNQALVELRTGNAKMALRMFEECLAFNQENGFEVSALRNYSGMKESYAVLGDFKTAYNYFRKYVSLRDTLMGRETKLEIAELEAKYNSAQQELELEKSERALVTAQRASERKGTILLFVLALALLAAWLWWRQNKRAQARIEENKKNLKVMTGLLARKNEALLKLQGEVEVATEELNDNPMDDTVNDEPEEEQAINLFDQSILTSTDWTDFKVYFENTFPGFVRRLRGAFNDITEAEERLFLLLKLNLTNKEISNILGISASSVKKTRNRLRKRLVLTPEQNLEEFIKAF